MGMDEPLSFDEFGLYTRVNALEPRLRLAFSASCLSRLVTPYADAAREMGLQDLDFVGRVVAKLWEALTTGAERPRWFELFAAEPAFPSAFLGTVAHLIADDGIGAAWFALGGLDAVDDEETLSAVATARSLYMAVDEFTRAALLDPDASGIDERAARRPLVQQELQRQHRDLADLSSTSLASAIARLRKRASGESALEQLASDGDIV